jgi:hypothetical protein
VFGRPFGRNVDLEGVSHWRRTEERRAKTIGGGFDKSEAGGEDFGRRCAGRCTEICSHGIRFPVRLR